MKKFLKSLGKIILSIIVGFSFFATLVGGVMSLCHLVKDYWGIICITIIIALLLWMCFDIGKDIINYIRRKFKF